MGTDALQPEYDSKEKPLWMLKDKLSFQEEMLLPRLSIVRLN